MDIYQLIPVQAWERNEANRWTKRRSTEEYTIPEEFSDRTQGQRAHNLG